MTLRKKQSKHASMVARLILFAESTGYEVTFGEAWRPPELVKIYAADGRGSSGSVHPLRLAIDLNLFKDGVYLTKTEDYLPLGLYWESMGGKWGGRFKRKDGNHFSLAHGRRA